MTEFSAGWILEVFIRNQVMLIALATVMHVRLWSQKSQGYQYKWSPNWMGKNRKFLWNDQVRDNVFWSVASAGTIWTGFEVVMLWAFANGIIPFVDPRQHPVQFILILCLVPLWRDFHFYWSHRMLHVKFLTRSRIMCTTRILTSDPGPACRCTRSSTCSITPACWCTGWSPRIPFT